MPNAETDRCVSFGGRLLSCPYAMRLSGWSGLAALAAITALFCLSGKLIVAGFESIPAHVPRTYPNLGACSCPAPNCSLDLG